jgi:thioesterase domain-containing protein
MAEAYLIEIREAQPRGPYLLGGWSMGGVVAFEIAGQLRAQGEEIALLALLDAWTPALAGLPPDDNLALLAGFAQDLGLAPDRALPALDHARQLEPDALLSILLEQARAAHAVPPDIELPQVRRLFHVFKTHTQALRRYVPQVYPGRLTLLRAAERFAADQLDLDQGWGALAADGVAQYDIPGSHYTMMRFPHVQGLGERLSACLDEIRSLD